MSGVSTPGISWPKVVTPGQRRRQAGLGLAMLLVMVVSALFLFRDSAGPPLVGFGILVAFLLGPARMFGKAMTDGVRWGRMGLFIDDDGITIGNRRPVNPRSAAWIEPQYLRYSVPWDAVYDVVLVPDPKVAEHMGGMAWRSETRGRADVDVAVRPPFFAGAAPLLTFRVDLRRAQVPPLKDGVLVSHVWAVPILDIDAVTREFEARSLPVTTSHDFWGVFVTDPMALDEDLYQEWLTDPILEDDPHPHIHRRFTGPAPRNLAEYEAACWFDHHDPHRVTDEVHGWDEERWNRDHLTPAILTPEGRAEYLEAYRSFRRRQRRRRRHRG